MESNSCQCVDQHIQLKHILGLIKQYCFCITFQMVKHLLVVCPLYPPEDQGLHMKVKNCIPFNQAFELDIFLKIRFLSLTKLGSLTRLSVLFL